MAKKAVIIYGPPGAGKGTQANLLAWTKGFIHFDTGKFLDVLLHDKDNQSRPGFAEALAQMDSGQLVTPEFVLKITTEEATKIGASNFSITFSGSPRTMFEAFGDEKNTGLVETLEKAYGKENVFPVHLVIDPHKAILRNKNRKVCSICYTAILYNEEGHQHSTCPLCGGALKTRTVDNPAVFETRIKEYEERTAPILEALKKRGYTITEIDGNPLPFDVFAEIKQKLGLE